MTVWKGVHDCLERGSFLFGKVFMTVWKGGSLLSGKGFMNVQKGVHVCLERGS